MLSSIYYTTVGHVRGDEERVGTQQSSPEQGTKTLVLPAKTVISEPSLCPVGGLCATQVGFLAQKRKIPANEGTKEQDQIPRNYCRNFILACLRN